MDPSGPYTSLHPFFYLSFVAVVNRCYQSQLQIGYFLLFKRSGVWCQSQDKTDRCHAKAHFFLLKQRVQESINAFFHPRSHLASLFHFHSLFIIQFLYTHTHIQTHSAMEPQHYYTAMTLRRRTSHSTNTYTNNLTPDGVTQNADVPLSKIENSQPTPSLPTWFRPTTPSSVTSSQQQQQRKPTDIFQLPFEILVGQILAILQLCDLARLALVSKAMQQLCQTDYLWQRKFSHDFHHRPNKTLRQLGSWKRIYQAMDRVEVYTWGNIFFPFIFFSLSHIKEERNFFFLQFLLFAQIGSN